MKKYKKMMEIIMAEPEFEHRTQGLKLGYYSPSLPIMK